MLWLSHKAKTSQNYKSLPNLTTHHAKNTPTLRINTYKCKLSMSILFISSFLHISKK